MSEIKIYFKQGEEPINYNIENMHEIGKLKDYHLIRYIKCNNCNLAKLPNELPRFLKGLYCENNNLTELPNLPESLLELHCSNNQLTSLPEIPLELQQLYCSNNQLIKLPDFIYDEKSKKNIYTFKQDYRIKKLICNNNQLTYLPKLPDSLEYLECSNNNITSLPPLPYLINYLDISYNKITKLPDNIHYLHYFYSLICNNNKITSLPYILPERLERLIISNNPIAYLSELPDYLSYLECCDTNVKHLPNMPKYMRRVYLEKELYENTKQNFPDFFTSDDDDNE